MKFQNLYERTAKISFGCDIIAVERKPNLIRISLYAGTYTRQFQNKGSNAFAQGNSISKDANRIGIFVIFKSKHSCRDIFCPDQ